MTTIGYELPREGHVLIQVLNTRGQLVRTLFAGRKESGSHAAVWDGRDTSGATLPSGTYFYRVRSAGTVLTKKMVLLK